MLAEAYKTKFFAGHEFAASEQKYLSLWIGTSSMMYAVSTAEFNDVFELGHLEFNQGNNQGLKENIAFFLQNFSLQQKKFQKVNISMLNSDFTILPEAFSAEQDLRSILTFSTGKTELKNAFSHRIKDFRFCFTLDQELLMFLERSFSNASIRHAGAVNLHLFFNHYSLANCNAFMVIGDATIEIMLKEKDKLIFYNVYPVHTNEDVLYYLLFAMEQYQMDPITTKLGIASQLKVNDELSLSIAKYVKHISFVVVGSPVKTHNKISELPQHFYFTLLNQHLCEL